MGSDTGFSRKNCKEAIKNMFKELKKNDNKQVGNLNKQRLFKCEILELKCQYFN